jgi:hypothetical protein
MVGLFCQLWSIEYVGLTKLDFETELIGQLLSKLNHSPMIAEFPLIAALAAGFAINALDIGCNLLFAAKQWEAELSCLSLDDRIRDYFSHLIFCHSRSIIDPKQQLIYTYRES